MTFSNQNSAIAQVKDYQTKEALKKTEDQFKQLNDTITALSSRVTTLESTQSSGSPALTNGAWEKLHTFTADGSLDAIKFEDTDGLNTQKYTTFMVIGEGLRPSVEGSSDDICVRFSQDGGYLPPDGSGGSGNAVYSYLGFAMSSSSAVTAPFQGLNQSVIRMSAGSSVPGSDATQAETTDFVAYFTTSTIAGRPSKFRWWASYETTNDQGFHGELVTTIGSAKMSETFVNHQSNTGTFTKPIDGIQLWFGDINSIYGPYRFQQLNINVYNGKYLHQKRIKF